MGWLTGRLKHYRVRAMPVWRSTVRVTCAILLGLSLLFQCLLAWPQPLQALCPTLDLSARQPDIPALPGVCFLQDNDRTLTPQDMLSGRWPIQRLNANQLSFTHTQVAYWVYVPVRNVDDADQAWLLQLDYPLLDEVDFWVYDLGSGGTPTAEPQLLETVQMGDGRPFAVRPIHHRLSILPLNLKPDQSLGVVLRVQSNGAIHIPLSLHTTRSSLENTQTQSLGQGMFMGAMLLLAVFNLTLFVRLRILQPFFNAVYVLCAGLFITSMSGLSFQYLWPESPWLANVAIPVTEVLAILSLLLFTRHFLDVRTQTWPRQAQAIRILFVIGAVLLPLSFWLPYSLITRINTVYALSCMLVMFGISIRHALLREHSAVLYMVSWVVFFSGFLLYALAAFGMVSGFIAQERWMQIGLGSQIFLLTYAEVMQLRGILDRALRLESSVNTSLQQQVQTRTADLQATMGALQKANDQLRELSLRDPLTGLLNRRGLDESLGKMLRNQDQLLALVIFDLDHFKLVNDHYGHDVGDEVLKWVAEVLSNLMRRRADVLARFGGEEFVVLLPDTSQEDVVGLVDRLLEHVRSHKVELAGNLRLSVTLSAGVAVRRPGDDALSLFRRADDCLYRSKDLGRDRLTVDSDDEDSERLADIGL